MLNAMRYKEGVWLMSTPVELSHAEHHCISHRESFNYACLHLWYE